MATLCSMDELKQYKELLDCIVKKKNEIRNQSETTKVSSSVRSNKKQKTQHGTTYYHGTSLMKYEQTKIEIERIMHETCKVLHFLCHEVQKAKGSSCMKLARTCTFCAMRYESVLLTFVHHAFFVPLYAVMQFLCDEIR